MQINGRSFILLNFAHVITPPADITACREAKRNSTHHSFTKSEIMNINDLEEKIRQSESMALSAAFPVLMRKVYVWMTMALAISALTAYGIASSPGLIQLIYSSKISLIILLVAELVLVWKISNSVQKENRSLAATTMMFIIFSALNGVTLSSIFVLFAPEAIIKTFAITAGTFAAMAIYGYSTRRDLTRLGGLLFMALIGLIIAAVVNMFMQSSTLDLAISAVGVLIFTGLTAWDSQKIKMSLAMAPGMDETSQKLAVTGALSLYLDFINLFLYLLRFFGSSRD